MVVTKQMKDKQYELEQVSVRLVDEKPLISEKPISSPQDAALLVGELLSTYDREAIAVINVSTAGKPINMTIASLGTINQSIVHPREIFKASFLSNANSILLAHNHPSGLLKPSDEDLKFTFNLVKAAKILGLRVLDHVIVGNDAQHYFSFQEQGIFSPMLDQIEIGERYQDLKLVNSVMAEQAVQYEEKPTEQKQTVDDKVKALGEQLQEGVQKLYQDGSYQKYLQLISKFPARSARNMVLLHMQNPDATYVKGYVDWQKLNRQVRAGEKGLKQFAPMKYAKEVDVDCLNDSGEKIGTEKKKIETIKYRVVYVYDVSQTDGEPLPEITHRLECTVENFSDVMQALQKISPYPIAFEEMHGLINGYCDYANQKIAIKTGVSEAQTVKTAIHEIVHAMLHSTPNNDSQKNVREIEAESVAYIVSNYYGLDTSDYSFGYVVSWSADQELKVLQASLKTIQTHAHQLINNLDKAFLELGIGMQQPTVHTQYNSEHAQEQNKSAEKQAPISIKEKVTAAQEKVSEKNASEQADTVKKPKKVAIER